MSQIQNWFINTRKRFLGPLKNEIEHDDDSNDSNKQSNGKGKKKQLNFLSNNQTSNGQSISNFQGQTPKMMSVGVDGAQIHNYNSVNSLTGNGQQSNFPNQFQGANFVNQMMKSVSMKNNSNDPSKHAAGANFNFANFQNLKNFGQDAMPNQNQNPLILPLTQINMMKKVQYDAKDPTVAMNLAEDNSPKGSESPKNRNRISQNGVQNLPNADQWNQFKNLQSFSSQFQQGMSNLGNMNRVNWQQLQQMWLNSNPINMYYNQMKQQSYFQNYPNKPAISNIQHNSENFNKGVTHQSQNGNNGQKFPEKTVQNLKKVGYKSMQPLSIMNKNNM